MKGKRQVVKIAVFWGIAPCILVDIDNVSEEITAFIAKIMHPIFYAFLY
jgi:hypothetical protein